MIKSAQPDTTTFGSISAVGLRRDYLFGRTVAEFSGKQSSFLNLVTLVELHKLISIWESDYTGWAVR